MTIAGRIVFMYDFTENPFLTSPIKILSGIGHSNDSTNKDLQYYINEAATLLLPKEYKKDWVIVQEGTITVVLITVYQQMTK